MAKAPKKVETVTVLRGVTLELSTDEAAVVCSVLGAIGGGGYVRERTSTVFFELVDALGGKAPPVLPASFDVGGEPSGPFQEYVRGLEGRK